MQLVRQAEKTARARRWGITVGAAGALVLIGVVGSAQHSDGSPSESERREAESALRLTTLGTLRAPVATFALEGRAATVRRVERDTVRDGVPGPGYDPARDAAPAGSSGAAYGVDGAAHRGALAVDGATVGVLACGVDVPYPRGHAGLIAKIADQGVLVGELPPGGHPTRSRFVLRNRVIAALTRGTVVVEAEYRSGSLVTARYARQLGRAVMGVPGPVTSGLSAGVHELLRDGATLVTDAAEVAELVGAIGELAPERRGPVVARDLLDPASSRVLEALPARASVNARHLARDACTGYEEVLAKLYELQSLGFVERHGERWQLTRYSRGPGRTRRGGP
ncbi:DNA-processing protein DprA [Streptomyces pathocidini]|uniref:DNA-processing protein DprA n=1 Tax=Streptomyces pathocidini TaxID=1650571 RepID=UPI00099F1E66|nr:DNA-processing protein DprA [Streptomyces pathocidini]